MPSFQIKQGRLGEARDMVESYVTLIDATGEEQCRAPLLLALALVQREEGRNTDAEKTANNAYVIADAQGAVLWKRWVEAEFRVSVEIET